MNESIKNPVVEVIGQGAKCINQIKDPFVELISLIFNVVEDTLMVSTDRRRSRVKGDILSFHRELVDQGVTPDKALDFIYDSKLTEAPIQLGNILRLVGENPSYFHAALRGIMENLPLGNMDYHDPFEVDDKEPPEPVEGEN